MRRTIFTPEHEQFRQTVRAFLEKECAPHTAEWLEAGVVSREAWRKVGEAGLLGWMVPEEYGGLGISDVRYSVVVAEEIAATGTQGIALSLHNDVVAPYLAHLTNAEQRQRWLPGFVAGQRLVAIAMSEPCSGRSWTAACSCTAATATSTSTRSPGSGGTPACSACTAAPPRS